MTLTTSLTTDWWIQVWSVNNDPDYITHHRLVDTDVVSQ